MSCPTTPSGLISYIISGYELQNKELKIGLIIIKSKRFATEPMPLLLNPFLIIKIDYVFHHDIESFIQHEMINRCYLICG